MQFTLHCKLAEKNHELPSKPFRMFLSGFAGVSKSFLITTITKYVKRVLRYPKQYLDQLYVLVTVSTGKYAISVNRISLHSQFHLPDYSLLKSLGCKKSSN